MVDHKENSSEISRLVIYTLMDICATKAIEGRDVVTCDIPEVFLQLD